jgi:hypothetical protein
MSRSRVRERVWAAFPVVRPVVFQAVFPVAFQEAFPAARPVVPQGAFPVACPPVAVRRTAAVREGLDMRTAYWKRAAQKRVER